MQYISNVIFALILVLGIGYFVQNIRQLIANIKLGKKPAVQGDKKERIKNVAYIAFGQSKMFKRPISGLLHLVVYLGFVIINIEVLEIVLDGLLGTHRLFAFLGPIYDVLIGTFEFFAALVVVAVAFFWLRRNALKLKRFWKPEMTGLAQKRRQLYSLY